MTEGWFAEASSLPSDSAIEAIQTGTAITPQEWPQLAIQTGIVADEREYFSALQETAVAACKSAVEAHAAASDVQIIHRVRAADDLGRVANELAERVIAWGAETRLSFDPTLDGVTDLAAESTDDVLAERVIGLAQTVERLIDQQETLHDDIETEMQKLAPNLTAIAGALLGARLIALAGGLESLARSTSGTVQVLGAEDALFAHLSEGAPPPKHGVIYTHEYVRGTDPAQRGSASRALAGKLAIAARIDYYAGDHRPEIEQELAERIATIRERER